MVLLVKMKIEATSAGVCSVMEQAWENWCLEMEKDDEEDDRHRDLMVEEEEFLRDILRERAFSSETESESEHKSTNMAAKTPNLSDSSPRTYILSFDSSTIIPTATPHPPQPSSKQQPITPPKRGRNASLDHIMAERKRRQQLSQSFIALSATIPGLKKTDKSSILGEAINYVKELQGRVRELEERNKRGKSEAVMKKKKKKKKKSDVCGKEDSNSSETESKDWCRRLPDIEARVMENEVLIEIHCEKEEGVELNLLNHLEKLHLSVTATSVLPFGNSTLGITIIAQMGDAFNMTLNEVVKNLRKLLLNHVDNIIHSDPY